MSEDFKDTAKLADKTAECMKTGDVACIQNVIGLMQDHKEVHREYMNNVQKSAQNLGLPDIGISYTEQGEKGYDEVASPSQNGIVVKLDENDNDKLSVVDNRIKEKAADPSVIDQLKTWWQGSPSDANAKEKPAQEKQPEEKKSPEEPPAKQGPGGGALNFFNQQVNQKQQIEDQTNH